MIHGGHQCPFPGLTKSQVTRMFISVAVKVFQCLGLDFLRGVDSLRLRGI